MKVWYRLSNGKNLSIFTQSSNQGESRQLDMAMVDGSEEWPSPFDSCQVSPIPLLGNTTILPWKISM